MTNDNSPKWYVLTAYKAELEARNDLAKEVQRRRIAGETPMDYFVPLYFKMENRGGKERLIKRALLPNFVFIKAPIEEIRRYKVSHPNLKYYNPKVTGPNFEYQTIPDWEMEMFMRVAAAYEYDVPYFQPTQAELEKGDRVRIIGGRFNGIEGVLISQQGKDGGRVVVNLTNVLAISTLEIEPQYLEIVSFAAGNKHIYKKFDAYIDKVRPALLHFYADALTADDLSAVSTFVQRMSRLETQTVNTRSKLLVFLLMSYTILTDKAQVEVYSDLCRDLLKELKSDYQRAFHLTFMYAALRTEEYYLEAMEAIQKLPASAATKAESLSKDLEMFKQSPKRK